jgi:imidazolonepropionase-like amidohydrolase
MKSHMFRHALVAFALLAAPLAAEVKVFKGFTLIDGSGRAPAAGSAMIVDNGRITWIGATANLKAPAGAQTIDLSGKFVMPGIINLHGHLGNVVDLTQDRKFYTRENVEKDLNTYASYGVTTMLSMGTDQDLIFRIRDEQRASGRPSMTRVFTAGQGFAFKGGYGGLPGVTFALVDSSEVEKDVAELANKHVDIVKMWVDDHLGHMKKMPFEIAKAIIDNGHKHGLPVAAHIFYLDDAKRLAGAGVNGFAHSVRDKPVDQELIDIMKKHGTWLAAATLTREASTFVYAKPAPFLKDPFFTRSVSAKTLATLKSPEYQKSIADDPDFHEYAGILEMAKKNLKKLSDAGVKYGFGTDAGPPGRFPGFFEQWEMELMVEAGLTPMQVIQAATKNAAEFLAAKDLGTLEPGKWADLVVLNADPLKNIRNTHKIQAVYIAGNKVWNML